MKAIEVQKSKWTAIHKIGKQFRVSVNNAKAKMFVSTLEVAKNIAIEIDNKCFKIYNA